MAESPVHGSGSIGIEAVIGADQEEKSLSLGWRGHFQRLIA